jgi:hypothetical protein
MTALVETPPLVGSHQCGRCRRYFQLLVEGTQLCMRCESRIPHTALAHKEVVDMTTTTITPVLRLTILKHLVSGKNLDVVSTIVDLPRGTVVDLASHHGFPSTDRMTRAIELLEKKRQEGNGIPVGDVAPRVVPTPTYSATTTPGPLPMPVSDLIVKGRGHESKRIQAAAQRAHDALAKLRQLLDDDAKKTAARRADQARAAAARSEVDRLERELAAAKAKLRGDKPPAVKPATPSTAPSEAAQVRAWAADQGIDCPRVGRIPRDVYDRFLEAQDGAA